MSSIYNFFKPLDNSFPLNYDIWLLAKTKINKFSNVLKHNMFGNISAFDYDKSISSTYSGSNPSSKNIFLILSYGP